MGNEYRENYEKLKTGDILVVDFTDTTTDYYDDASYTLPPHARTVHVKVAATGNAIKLPNVGQMQGHLLSIMNVSQVAGTDTAVISSDDAYNWSTDPGNLTLTQAGDRVLLYCDGCVWYLVESANI